MDNIQYLCNSCFLVKTMYLDRISLSVFQFKYTSQSSPLREKTSIFKSFRIHQIRYMVMTLTYTMYSIMRWTEGV